MCGRYVLALRPSQVRQMMEDENMPVHDAPEDEGDGAPRQSYNFAPGYHGVVYRADVPDRGAGPQREARSKKGKAATENNETELTTGVNKEEDTLLTDGGGEEVGEAHYKLQSMKWGLVPFWTKRNPDYAAVMKTINCRDDSLSQTGGMWSSIKGRKRCVVVAQGFYEWLKSGKEKVPHYVTRKDGKLMCFAGLWDCVQYEGHDDKHYTYTIITTDSNKQLKFLHDRMPVILGPASDELKTWLNPTRYEWSKDLQTLLKPFDGELEVYPVSKEVGKVGNNSASFIIPINSRENKSNIANFFANAQTKAKTSVEIKKEMGSSPVKDMEMLDGIFDKVDDRDAGVSSISGVKRKADGGSEDDGPPPKTDAMMSASPAKIKVLSSPTKPPSKVSRTISATNNGTRSPAKGKGNGTQKITKFFSNNSA